MSSPKQHFLTAHKEVADRLYEAVGESWFKTSTHYALAEFSTKNPSAEAMSGVNEFLSVFETLADKTEKQIRPEPGYGVERPQKEKDK
jgi:hypothetical protein